MSKYQNVIWGLDLKPPRKGPRPRRNRYTGTHRRLISPALVALATLGYFIVAALW